MSDIDERIAALKEEVAGLEEERFKAFAEFGEKAFPEIRKKEGFSEIAEKIDALTVEIDAKGEQEKELLAEQERLEQEEKERILKCTCYSCQYVNTEDAVFCENCGAKLGEPPREYCKNCGTMNQPTLKFCGECGTKLDED